MTDQQTAPPTYTRLIRLAERDPGRGVRVCQHAYQRSVAGPERAWAALALGRALTIQERPTEARPLLEEALELLTAHAAIAGMVVAQRALLIFAPAGVATLTALDALAATCTAAGLAHEATRTWFEYISLLNRLGRPQQALTQIEQIAAAVEHNGTAADYGRLARLRGVALTDLGYTEAAINAFNQALAYYQKEHQPVQQASCLLNRAWTHQRREAFDAAFQDLSAAAQVFRRYGLTLNLAFCQRDQGLVAARLGQFDQALAATFQAQTFFQQQQRNEASAICTLNLGVIATYSGQYELAQAAYQQALHLFVGLSMQREQLVVRRNHALVLCAQGDAIGALAELQALEGATIALGERLELAENLANQGRALRDLGQLADAEAQLLRAEAQFDQIGSQPAVAECWLERGWLALEQGQIDTARALLQSAHTGLVGRPIHRWRADYGLGRCAALQGDLDQAAAYYRSAGAAIVGMRQRLASEHASSGLFAQARQLYADALNLAVTQGDSAAALYLASEQRALALTYQISQKTIAIPPHLQAIHEQQRATLRALAGAADPQTLDLALRSYTGILLHVQHNQVHTGEHELMTDFDLAMLQHTLTHHFGEDWSLLSFADVGNALIAITLDPNGSEVSRITLNDDLRQLLEQACLPRYRRFTYMGLRQDNWATLRALGSLLLPPRIQQTLTAQRRLLIVPCGLLHGLPWAALRINNHWLCEQSIIQILPGEMLWMQLANRTPTASNAGLLLGCRDIGQRAAPLPNVLAHLDLAEQCWPGQCDRLEDAAAARTTLLALSDQGGLQQYALIQIACHAQLTAARGLLAHIKLADDDLLYDEVARLKLGGALVILLACEGGLGEVLPGEEVLSLNRALLAAGARDVLAGLWQLFDTAIPALLVPLYQALAQGQDAPTALALAQRTLINQHVGDTPALAMPFVWAGLTVLGAGTR